MGILKRSNSQSCFEEYKVHTRGSPENIPRQTVKTQVVAVATLRSSFLGLATWFSSCVWCCWNSFLCHLCVTWHCPQDLPAGTAACKLETGSRVPLSSHLWAERPASGGHPATRWSPTARWLQPCSCVPAKQKHLFPSFFLSRNSLPHSQVRSHRPGGDVSGKLSSISESPFLTMRHFLSSHFVLWLLPSWGWALLGRPFITSCKQGSSWVCLTSLHPGSPYISCPSSSRCKSVKQSHAGVSGTKCPRWKSKVWCQETIRVPTTTQAESIEEAV